MQSQEIRRAESGTEYEYDQFDKLSLKISSQTRGYFIIIIIIIIMSLVTGLFFLAILLNQQ
jgi:uncharacterized membrane protein